MVKGWQSVMTESLDNKFKLAITLFKNNQISEATETLEEIVKKDPTHKKALSTLGVVYVKLGRFQDARQALETLKEYDVATQQDLLNLADLYIELKEARRGAEIYQEILRLDKNQYRANLGIGRLFFSTENYDLALPYLEKAFEQKPDEPLLAGNIFEVKRRLVIWNDYDRMKNKLWGAVTEGKVSAHPWSLFSAFDYPELHLVSHLNMLKALGVSGIERQRFELDDVVVDGDERIRIGYFSPDFRRHAVTSLILEMLEQHDRQKFEVFAYYFPPLGNDRSDFRTDAVRSAVDQFHQVGHWSDDEILEQVRSDKIQIAVDLCGLTTGNRVRLFARGLAPLQVSYLGYPGTLGAHIWDYIIADAEVISKDNRKHYSERIAYVDGCFQPNDSRRRIDEPRSRAEYGLPSDAFVLCSFNDTYKLTPQLVDTWFKVLVRMKQVVLWIKAESRVARENLLRLADIYQVERDRVIFAGRVGSYEEHLARYQRADLFLDTYPYNGHTTASDVLWAGLPLITIKGESNCSRVCASILTYLGISELVSTSMEDYEQKILKLVSDRAYYLSMKERVLQSRESDLFDGAAAAKRAEEVYARLWALFEASDELPLLLDCRKKIYQS